MFLAIKRPGGLGPEGIVNAQELRWGMVAWAVMLGLEPKHFVKSVPCPLARGTDLSLANAIRMVPLPATPLRLLLLPLCVCKPPVVIRLSAIHLSAIRKKKG